VFTYGLLFLLCAAAFLYTRFRRNFYVTDATAAVEMTSTAPPRRVGHAGFGEVADAGDNPQALLNDLDAEYLRERSGRIYTAMNEMIEYLSRRDNQR
jgi:hypothetical protein